MINVQRPKAVGEKKTIGVALTQGQHPPPVLADWTAELLEHPEAVVHPHSPGLFC